MGRTSLLHTALMMMVALWREDEGKSFNKPAMSLLDQSRAPFEHEPFWFNDRGLEIVIHCRGPWSERKYTLTEAERLSE